MALRMVFFTVSSESGKLRGFPGHMSAMLILLNPAVMLRPSGPRARPSVAPVATSAAPLLPLLRGLRERPLGATRGSTVPAPQMPALKIGLATPAILRVSCCLFFLFSPPLFCFRSSQQRHGRESLFSLLLSAFLSCIALSLAHWLVA